MSGVYGGMFRVTFANGTAQQRQWVRDALDTCQFPWERVQADVTVEFVNDPIPGFHYEVASTEFSGTGRLLISNPPPHPVSYGGEEGAVEDIYRANYPSDLYLRPTVQIYKGLDDPKDPLYISPQFFAEIVVHEFAHVIAGSFTDLQINRICGCLGVARAEWNPPGTTRESWMERGAEAFAETFKDLFMPRDSREYDNRTSFRLIKEKLDDFYDVLDEIIGYQHAGERTTYGGISSVNFDGLDRYRIGQYTSSLIASSITRKSCLGEVVWFAFDNRMMNWGHTADMNLWADYPMTDMLYVFYIGEIEVDQFAFNAANPPGQRAVGPYAFSGIFSEDVDDELLDWRADVAGVEDPSFHGAALVPDPEIPDNPGTYWATNKFPTMGNGITMRYRYPYAPDMPRPPWPYVDLTIDATPGPAGRIRRSNP